jgi:hypothetical protein
MMIFHSYVSLPEGILGKSWSMGGSTTSRRSPNDPGAAQHLLMLRVAVVMCCGQLLTLMVKLCVELLVKPRRWVLKDVESTPMMISATNAKMT